MTFMARDAGVGEQSVIRVLYIKQHYTERFAKLKARARESTYEILLLLLLRSI